MAYKSMFILFDHYRKQHLITLLPRQGKKVTGYSLRHFVRILLGDNAKPVKIEGLRRKLVEELQDKGFCVKVVNVPEIGFNDTTLVAKSAIDYLEETYARNTP